MPHVIIAGFGPVGGVLAETFREHGVPFTVIEMNAATVRGQRSLGRSIVRGDATNAEVLELAGIRDATAVVITIPDPTTSMRICQLARSLAPSALIVIRTRHLSEALQAKQLGANIAVVEEIETAKAMTTAVTAALKSCDQSQRTCADQDVLIERAARSKESHSRHARDCSPQPEIASCHS